MKCKSTEKLPAGADLIDLARQCLESKGIPIRGLWSKDQTLYVTLSPPARLAIPGEAQPAASPESEHERLRAERLRETYGINVDAPIPDRRDIIKRYMEAHNGKQPSLEDELKEAFRQYRVLSAAQSAPSVGLTPSEAHDPAAVAPGSIDTNRLEKERSLFVQPRLDKRGWSIKDWAEHSNVDFHTANDYLKGKTAKPYKSTRLKLAKSLHVAVGTLPK